MDKIPNGILIFASRYGSTEEYACKIAGALDFSIARVQDLRLQDLGSEHLKRLPESKPVILGSPIYGPSVLPEMVDFLQMWATDLAKRIVGAFVVCGDDLWITDASEGGSRNLDKLTSLLLEEPPVTAVFSGRMIMDDLSEKDRVRILAFYDRIGKEPLGFDRMDLDAVEPFVEKIENILEKD